MIDLNNFGTLGPEEAADSERLMAKLDELREFFGIKQQGQSRLGLGLSFF